jgi:hypothetical protein
MPERINATMQLINEKIFDRKNIYNEIEMTEKCFSGINRFFIINAASQNICNDLKYSNANIHFRARPFSAQLAKFFGYDETHLAYYTDIENTYSFENFRGEFVFYIENMKNNTYPHDAALTEKAKKILYADDNKLLKKYCNYILYKLQCADKIYRSLQWTAQDLIVAIRNNPDLYQYMEKIIYAQAAALNDFGYDAVPVWKESNELLKGTFKMTEDKKYEHLYATIEKLNTDLEAKTRELHAVTNSPVYRLETKIRRGLAGIRLSLLSCLRTRLPGLYQALKNLHHKCN